MPVIEIGVMATNVNHAIDRAAAPQHLATRLIADAPFQAALRHRLERPVHMSAGQDGSDPDRGMDQRRAVFRARLKQAHSNLRVGTQPVGQYAACRTCTDNYVIENHHGRLQGNVEGDITQRQR
ncbi:hypothetical protein D3C81_1539520 [compost metagenome]